MNRKGGKYLKVHPKGLARAATLYRDHRLMRYWEVFRVRGVKVIVKMVRLGWAGLGWVGLGWVGLGWGGLGWVGLGWVG